MSKAKKPVTVVYFYMIGCPHCEAMRPAWEDAKTSMKNVEVKEVESNDVQMDDNVSSFPTIVVRKNGKEVKRLEGERKKGGDIMKELKLGGGRAKRRLTHRGKRQTRHRTLRNYKPFA